MAHVGRRWPLHWRRDMTLNTAGNADGWPMTARRIISGFELPGITVGGVLNYSVMSFPDWDGLTLRYESDAIAAYGKFFQIQTSVTWVENCARIESGIRVEMSGIGLVLQGTYRHQSGTNPWAYFTLTTLADCLHPTLFRPYQTYIQDGGLLPSWQQFHTDYPGVKPWPPS